MHRPIRYPLPATEQPQAPQCARLTIRNTAAAVVVACALTAISSGEAFAGHVSCAEATS